MANWPLSGTSQPLAANSAVQTTSTVTMSSRCWSAWSVCSLSVTFSLGWAEFHFAIVGAQTLLLSLPVTNVIGPRELAPACAELLEEELPLLHPAVTRATVAAAANATRARRLLVSWAIRPPPNQWRAGG